MKLHGKGGTALPPSTEDRMAIIRDIASTYEAQNIYYMEESGLLYRMGPNRTYLTAVECRASTRGTEMLKHEQRVTVVMCINAYGSHAFPVHYTGKAETPICLRLLFQTVL